MKSVEERMDMIAAYRETGSYRAAADICDTTPKTVKRTVAGELGAERARPEHNYEQVRELVADKLNRTKGRISAKRLLPAVRAAGYDGSDRNFRRLVATERRAFRARSASGRRPGVWSPGDVLAFDWGETGKLFMFCAVLAWSRVRYVRFFDNLGADATLEGLAGCFEYLGGVPAVALTDRMGCLRSATVAGVVVPTADYVRFAGHYRIRPDFCLAADPESKGLVENLVGYAKSDLVVPGDLCVKDLAGANAAAEIWMGEVNGQVHSEICAVPAERLESEGPLLGPLPELRPTIGKIEYRKVDKLSCVRFGSGRYSVPTSHVGERVAVAVAEGTVQISVEGEIIATHNVVAPGEASVQDDHYGGARRGPSRGPRPASSAEEAFVALGPAASEWLKASAAGGNSRLAADIDQINELVAAHGNDIVLAALERAVAFGRHRAADIDSIIAAGTAAHAPGVAAGAVIVDLPTAARRSLADYAIGAGQ